MQAEPGDRIVRVRYTSPSLNTEIAETLFTLPAAGGARGARDRAIFGRRWGMRRRSTLVHRHRASSRSPRAVSTGCRRGSDDRLAAGRSSGHGDDQRPQDLQPAACRSTRRRREAVGRGLRRARAPESPRRRCPSPCSPRRGSTTRPERPGRSTCGRTSRGTTAQPFTADDVAFTLEAIFDPKVPNSSKHILTVGGAAHPAEVVDPPHDQAASWPSRSRRSSTASGSASCRSTSSEHALADGTFAQAWGIDTPPEKIIGTGPYRLSRYVPAQLLQYTRNPTYWMRDENGGAAPASRPSAPR